MKIIIVGAGVVGTHLAKQLIVHRHEVVIIEANDLVVFQLRHKLDCLIINAEGNDMRALKRAGVGNVDLLVAVTHSDELNLLICGMVKAVDGKPAKIARIRNIRYSSPDTYLENFKVDFVVNPEIEAAHAVIRSLETNALSDVLEFSRAALQIRNIAVDSASPICDKSVKAIIPLAERLFLFALIYRNNKCIIPTGDTVIRAGDVIYVAAEDKDFEFIYRAFGIAVERLRKIVIAGGGRIGRLIANYIVHGYKRSPLQTITERIRRLLRKIQLVIVEKDYERGQKLAEDFPQALIINDDISNSDLFVDEDLASADLLIATTGNEEINLLSATYGKSIGIKKAMVVVSKTDYPVIAHTLKIDAAISIKNTVVNAILKRIHRRHIRSIHSLLDGLVEVLELDVGAHSKIIDRKLRDVALPEQCIILNITRNKSTHIPRGEFVIREGDEVIVIASRGTSDKVSKLIGGTPLG